MTTSINVNFSRIVVASKSPQGLGRCEARVRSMSSALALLATLGLSTAARANDNDVPIQRPVAQAQNSPSAEAASNVTTQAPTNKTTDPFASPSPAASEPSPSAATAPAQPAPLPLADRSAQREPARTPPPSSARRSAPKASGTGLHTTHEPRKKERLPHRGFTLDGRVGTAGCLGSLCANSHRASPGVRLDGFLGGNIRGWVDLGVSGGWGTFNANVEQDENLLRLYGVEPAHLQAAAQAAGRPLQFNPFALQVRSAKLWSARFGPSLRIHLIPRGRGIAYIGSGFGYSTFMADYQTATGPTSMRLHGFDVPVQAGAGVQIIEHLAVVAQFDYTFTRYPLAQFEHPQEALTLPVALLDNAAAQSGNSVSDSLPQYWSVGVGLRARF